MSLIIKNLAQQDYQTTWHAMQQFTSNRTPTTPDEIWIVEHPPVYTQGQAGKAEHILNPQHIPVIQSDRGGQVTYHGPGQLVVYVLLDLNRLHIGIRRLVNLLENTIIEVLKEFNVIATARCDAPGVYVNHEKICSIGLRIKRGYSYHGLAFNVNMDLAPFDNINPCGYKGMKMTQLKDHHADPDIHQVSTTLIQHLTNQLSAINGVA